MPTTHGFWVGVEDNRVFDGVVARHLVTYGDIIVINGFYNSDSYSYRNIVQRLHEARQGFRVLLYTWGGRKPLGATHIGAVPTLDGMENENFLLKDTAGNLIKITRPGVEFILLDPRLQDARIWLKDRVSTVVRALGSDGVGLDGSIRRPRFPRPIVDPASYPPNFDLMIRGVSETMPITIFNGLSPGPDQELLLESAHGAAIEYFGLRDRAKRKPSFTLDILRYFGAIERYHNRTFLVFGRASRRPTPYTTYDQDWLWQRYLYCAYLLAAGPNTRWKHHAGFLASPNSGRAGGLDVYADALHDLGSPLGDYTVEGGCYRRAFERGLVLIVPAETPKPQSVWINRPMFTLDGAWVFAGRVTIAPGEGHVLLYRRPAPPQALIRQFDLGFDPLWRWSELQQVGWTSYLHLDATPDGEESEHDLALDLVRYRAPRGQVTLWYRTSDSAARVEIVVEVDDRDREVRFVLVDGSLAIGGDSRRRPAQFRAKAPPISQFARLRVVGGGAPLIADGGWHTLVVDVEAACAASGRYEFRHAVFARLLGSMDIRRLRLAGAGVVFRARGKARRGGRFHTRRA